ncbi:MAG: BAX inhibitor (BI)-1/YccA family protein, partial [Kiloniellales bacterium]
MAFDPQRTTMTRTEAARAEIDVGLRSYMLRVYNYMSLGVAFTGAIAMMVATNESLVMSIASMFWVFF